MTDDEKRARAEEIRKHIVHCKPGAYRGSIWLYDELLRTLNESEAARAEAAALREVLEAVEIHCPACEEARRSGPAKHDDGHVCLRDPSPAVARMLAAVEVAESYDMWNETDCGIHIDETRDMCPACVKSDALYERVNISLARFHDLSDKGSADE